MTSLLSPILQAGAFGLCVLLIWLLRDVLTSNRKSLDGNTSAINGLTQATIGVNTMVGQVLKTSEQVRDRIQMWDCPFREEEESREREVSEWEVPT